MDLITILEKTTSSDQSELEYAQKFLEQAAQQNLPELLKSLSEVLSNGTNSPVARMQAGLQLKNALYSKDANLKMEYQQRWLQFPEDVRIFVKMNVLNSMGTETVRPSSAAQCVANIACTELPQGLWPDLISKLCQNVTNPGSTEMMKESCLEAVGYINQDIDPEILLNQSNEILTAIVHGMKKEETSNNVRNAATNALLNSLEFTKANFDKETERHFIMQVVCEATQSEDTRVRVAALQCLVKIMSLYYVYMEHYMGPALFAITVEAMKSEVDEIALQGIEFWSTVCDEEVDLAIELSEASEAGKPPERTSRFYAKGALQYLVPILLSCLTKQEEFDDDDEWNPCKAAGVCLMLMASCCEDDIINHVLPFVKDNIRHENWRFRDASVMAFGSILEGPDPSTLKQLVDQALPMLIESLKDHSVIVRDTGAWTIGRVCEILPEAVINEQYLNPLLHALVEGLDTEPRVASNVCWAFSSLAEAAYENAEQPEDGSEPTTNCLSSYFEQIVQKLIQTADRGDGNQNNLRNAAYEAIMEMMKNSTKDCYAIVLRTLVLVLDKLDKVLKMESMIQVSSDRSQFLDLTSLLCATLQSVLRRITPEDAAQISDQVMSTLLCMFQSSTGKSGGVQEDALLAVSTLTEVLGESFLKYMDAFKPFLLLALKNHAEYQVCIAAVGLVGDLSRALGQKVLPFCDEIMMLLLQNLGNEGVHRSVKPQILSIFGDIALAVGPFFKNYLEVVLTTLQQATQAQVDKTDYDMIDYLNELREGCLEAYTGMVQGLKGDTEQPNADVALLQSHVGHMISFIEHIALDEDHSDSNISACCGLIGDLCTTFGVSMIPLVDKEPITGLLSKGRRSKANKCKTLATWATKEIRKLKNAQSWTLLFLLVFMHGYGNILQNGGFEMSSFRGNWYGNGCNITKSNDAYHGQHSVLVSNRRQSWQSVAQKVTIYSLGHYKATAYVKLLDKTHQQQYHSVGLTLKCQDGHGKNKQISFGKTSRVLPGDWYEIGGVIQSVNGSHNCNVFVDTPFLSDFLVDSAQLTRTPYDSQWKSKANQRIEQIRKADVWVNVTGAHSSHVDIELFQTKMEFAIGSAVEARLFVDPTKQKYPDTFYKNFEWGVLGNALKWKAMERKQGQMDYDRSMKALNAMEAHGIKVRCHCVFWDKEDMVQDWVKALNPSMLMNAVNNRIHDVMNYTKGKCEQWDVLNEMFHWNFFEKHTGNPHIGQYMFQKVHAADQKPLLFLNDFGVLSSSSSAVDMKDTALKYLKAGVPLGGIGVQGHMHDIDITLMKARLDILAEAGLPIMITEFAVNEKDEHKKASLLSNSLTLFFSHPSVMGVILWGFWDGHIWEPDAVLYTGPNVTANAAGRAYENIFHITWRTHVTHTVTGNQQYHVRGFKGEYSLKVKHNGHLLKSETFMLQEGGQHLHIHLNSNAGGAPSVSPIIVG